MKDLFPYSKIVGWVISGLLGALLIFSATLKMSLNEGVVKEMTKFGYPESSIFPIGVVEIAGVVLFLLPRTSLFGIALLTAYLGGTCATHIRASEGCTPNVIMATILWIGFLLRYPDVVRGTILGNQKTSEKN